MKSFSSKSHSANPKSATQNPKWLALSAIAFAIVVIGAAAEAQQPGNLPRIGFLSGRGEPTPSAADPSFEAFRQGLIDLGYIDGKNILIETRYVEGKLDRVSDIVDELVQLKV